MGIFFTADQIEGEILLSHVALLPQHALLQQTCFLYPSTQHFWAMVSLCCSFLQNLVYKVIIINTGQNFPDIQRMWKSCVCLSFYLCTVHAALEYGWTGTVVSACWYNIFCSLFHHLKDVSNPGPTTIKCRHHLLSLSAMGSICLIVRLYESWPFSASHSCSIKLSAVPSPCCPQRWDAEYYLYLSHSRHLLQGKSQLRWLQGCAIFFSSVSQPAVAKFTLVTFLNWFGRISAAGI